MNSNKKSRAKNFTASEESYFVEVILPIFKEKIECKQTDAQTRAEKAAAWVELTAAFNAGSTFCPRTEENLKNLWDRLKKNARKAQASERLETFATGGGSRDDSAAPTQTDLKVLSVLGPSGAGLLNHFDGDSEAGSSQCDEQQAASDVCVLDIDFSNIEVPTDVKTWSDIVPRHLYSKKPEALRASKSAGSSSSSGSSSTSGSDKKTRTVAEELEWARICKRRRPSVPQDDNQVKLTVAKLELTEATKARIEEERKRSQELFEIEKRRKESEAELAALQVIKMKKELGLL